MHGKDRVRAPLDGLHVARGELGAVGDAQDRGLKSLPRIGVHMHRGPIAWGDARELLLRRIDGQLRSELSDLRECRAGDR